MNQSLSEVMQNQINSLITFDTQLKTALNRCYLFTPITGRVFSSEAGLSLSATIAAYLVVTASYSSSLLVRRFNKSKVVQRCLYSYRQRYSSSQWSKCCGLTRRSRLSLQQISYIVGYCTNPVLLQPWCICICLHLHKRRIIK